MPLTTTSSYAGSAAAATSGQEAKQYPSGQEKATNANAGLAKQTDISDPRDKGK